MKDRRSPPTRFSPRRPSMAAKMTAGVRCALALLLGLPWAVAVYAVQPNETLPGFKTDNVLEAHGIDNINLFSGDPGVVVPLGPEYTLGPTFKWQLKAYYSAKLWHMSGCSFDTTTFADLHGDPTIGVGWNLQVGYVVAKVVNTGVAYKWIYHSPDGGSHEFNLSSGTTVPPYSDISKDGTHLRLTASSNPTNPNTNPPNHYTLEFPDGTVQTFGNSFSSPRQLSGTSPDLSELDVGETPSNRFGLSTIKDSFGTTLLTVNYLGSKAWEVSSILLNPTGKSITFSWSSATGGYPANGVNWDVLNSVSFPATGSSTLTVQFAYQPGTFVRSNYDNSANQTACPPASPPTVAVPELSQITFTGSGFNSFNYQFAYFSAPSSDQVVQKQGALQRITLPTGGTIQYDYDKTTANACQIGPGCDPEATIFARTTHVAQPANLSSNLNRFNKFLDKSIAVSIRTETNGGVQAITYYDRAGFVPLDSSGLQDDGTRILRRTIVTSPGNDTTGSAQFATRHYFHVAFLTDSDDQPLDGGTELERRTYPGSDVTVSPVRSEIFCYERSDPNPPYFADQCGYHTSGGVIQVYQSHDVRPQLGQVTWFGAVPSSSDGGTCPTGSTPCIRRLNSNYIANAGQYTQTDVVTRNVPSGASPDHTTFTDWTPWTDASHWLLGLYDQKNDQEGGAIVYRGYEFDSGLTGANGLIATAGFLRGVMTSDVPYDQTNRKLMLECSYPDAAGNVGKEFSATYVPAPAPLGSAGITSIPYSKTCSAAYPTYPSGSIVGVIGINNDAFGHFYTWTHGLLSNGAWVTTNAARNPLAMNWFDFNVNRDTGSGLITTSYDTANVSTGYTYDALGRIAQISPTSELTTFICYDTTTRTTVYRSTTQGSCPVGGLSSPIQTWQQYLYDGLGRLTREIRAIPGASGVGTSYAARTHAYDSAGHKTLDSEWAGCSSVNACLSLNPGGTTNSNFDPFGRAQTTQHADGSTTTINFSDGSISFSDTQKAVTVNNINGTCNGTCVNGTPATTTYAYDSYGRLTKVTEPTGEATTYAYDANGNLTTVTQGSQGRTFTYDQMGFLRSEFTPEKGTVTYNTIGSLGNVAQRTENDGTVISTIYDSAGRTSCTGQGVINMTQGSGTCANTWSVPTTYIQNFYDGNGFAGGSNPLGKLTRRVGSNPLSSPASAVTDDFNYSALGGRISQLSTTVTGGALGTVSQTWAYNNLGLVIQHAHERPSGNGMAPLVESTTYNAGLPVAVYANGIPAVTAVDYAPSGAVNHYTTGLFATQTVITTVTPDPTLMPRPSQISTTGALFNTGAYTYDGAGNITAMGADSFSYDNRSRLTSANLSGAGSQSYTYDRYGNLLTKGGTTFCSGTCSNNRITGYSYDSRGNQLSGIGETYTYDVLDRTKTSTAGGLTSKYLFDGASERVTKIDSNNNWTYTFRDEASRVSTEFAGAAQSRDNIFLGHQIVGSYANGSVGSNGPVWSFYSSDHLGSPRLVTDAGAGQVEARRYWPFGEQVIAASPFQHIRFAAMEQDTEAGLGNDRYSDHARQHAAGLGRFLSADLHTGQPESPQTWNRYSYSYDNPIRYVDPNGEDGVEVANHIDSLVNKGIGLVEGVFSSGSAIQDAAVVAGELVKGTADLLRVGAATGEALGSGGDSTDVGNAIATDIGRGSGLVLALASPFKGVGGAGGVADDLAGAAGRATESVGPGRGPAYGTRVHSAFEKEVNALGRSDLSTEVSYKNGVEVRRGTPGSVRLDVVQGSRAAPKTVFDLKTGSAKLTAQRIQQIQKHIPGGSSVPVIEIR